MQEYGTVISTQEGPSTRRFSFVVSRNSVVRRGQFVQIEMPDGKLVGRVSDVFKTNRYFMRPDSVTEYESSGRKMDEIFPTGDWEYLVADVRALGISRSERFADATFPPSPGMRVTEPEHGILISFFGLDESGIHVGDFNYHDLQVKLNPTKLLQKHLAILAISGAGKSFLSAVLIEELLGRSPEQGQVAVIVLDTHGEYTSFANDPNYAHATKVFPSDSIRIGLSGVSTHRLGEYMTGLSGPQLRELSKIMRGLDAQVGIDDLIARIESSEDVKSSTRDVLLASLEGMRSLEIFDANDSPSLDELARQGGLSVLDLSGTVDLRKKQVIADHVARKLFNARRDGTVPPFLLVLEEAHQFVPETAKRENALSRGIISTIAREGRKFNASLCLISQRPIQLSTTVLSQCNTHIIMRVTNPYDLEHIGKSSEGITRSVLDQISSLQVGSGLIVGEAVNSPLFVKIRPRSSKESEHGMSLEKAAVDFHEKTKQKEEDAKSFM
jgi:DNA helicase HerA-like ATPase